MYIYVFLSIYMYNYLCLGGDVFTCVCSLVGSFVSRISQKKKLHNQFSQNMDRGWLSNFSLEGYQAVEFDIRLGLLELMVIRLLVVLEIRSGGPRCHQGPCSWEHECRKIKICENASCICWDVLLDKGKVWLAAGARWKARLLPRVWTGLDHLDSIVYNLSKQTNKLKWPKLQGLTDLVFSEVCTSITFQRANEVKLGLNKSQHGAFFWQIDQLSWFEFTQKAIVRFCHIITKCQLSVIRPQNTGHIWWICSWFQLLSGELPVPLIVFRNQSFIHSLALGYHNYFLKKKRKEAVFMLNYSVDALPTVDMWWCF